jgi:UDPglucose 6-dehydrogenase
MQVTVIGTGYVGLVAGACFAHGGIRVICVDIDAHKVEALRSGEIPIYEPGLDDVVRDTVASGQLTFTTQAGPAVAAADAVFIAVGTPPSEDGSADLSHVMAVARGIAPHLTGYTAVVCKSTVPIGTCDKVAALLAKAAPVEAGWDIVSNPEFLREGVALKDFFEPDRVVIGTTSARARDIMTAIYAPFATAERIHFMAVRSAEMTKYAANCMLATRISFINEIAGICDRLGVDVRDVKNGIGADSRIGPAFLNAGIGYGGSCFPKDVKALLSTGRDAGCDVRLLEVVEAINYDQKGLLARRLFERLGEDLSGRRVAMLGLAFKPHTDDMRQAPSIRLARMLVAAGAVVTGYDPVARETARRAIGDAIAYADSWQEAVVDADAILLVTEWPALCALSPAELKQASDCRLLLDGRNSWDPALMQAAGFDYQGVGRPPRIPKSG